MLAKRKKWKWNEEKRKVIQVDIRCVGQGLDLLPDTKIGL